MIYTCVIQGGNTHMEPPMLQELFLSKCNPKILKIFWCIQNLPVAPHLLIQVVLVVRNVIFVVIVIVYVAVVVVVFVFVVVDVADKKASVRISGVVRLVLDWIFQYFASNPVRKVFGVTRMYGLRKLLIFSRFRQVAGQKIFQRVPGCRNFRGGTRIYVSFF